jgi:hypothetical protein
MFMLKLTDLIRLSGLELGDFKIHCATGVESSPFEAFLDGTWKQWQESQNQKNFECDQILSLIHLGGERWLFAGVFAVLGVKAGNIHNPNGFEYSTKEIEGLDHLTGRAIVTFDKDFRQSYLRGPRYESQLVVAEIRGQRMTVGDFRGFNHVLLSHTELQTVVRESIPSWKAALQNVSGVYVITDKTTGKQYVGSASGVGGIWQRWCAYAKTGHGDNNELQQLLIANSANHVRHLQFAILEVCDLNAGENEVLKRESHWKDVLRTREFGLN